MNFDTSSIDSRDKYRLLNGGVTPRPIAWISTRSKAGVDNIAPYSFFTVASCDPPVLLYTQVTQRSGIDKDTLQNLQQTGECVVNIVNTQLLEQMNSTSAAIAPDASEFEYANIKQTASQVVRPRSVNDSPIRYECTLREIISLGDLPAGGTLVLLDVKSVYVRDDLLDGGVINQQLIDPVGKMGGDLFSVKANYIALERP